MSTERESGKHIRRIGPRLLAVAFLVAGSLGPLGQKLLAALGDEVDVVQVVAGEDISDAVVIRIVWKGPDGTEYRSDYTLKKKGEEGTINAGDKKIKVTDIFKQSGPAVRVAETVKDLGGAGRFKSSRSNLPIPRRVLLRPSKAVSSLIAMAYPLSSRLRTSAEPASLLAAAASWQRVTELPKHGLDLGGTRPIGSKWQPRAS